MHRKTIISSLIFKFFERVGSQGIAFIVGLILARLLTPSDYGLVSMLTIFIAVAGVFVQSGLGTALVQKKGVDEQDYSSVFYLSLLIAIIMYILLFAVAPFISDFYRMPQITSLLRINALILIPGAFNSIQNAKLVKEMQFKKMLFCNLGAVLISGFIGVFMAFQGYGAWALVGQQIAGALSICVIMLFAVKWKPKLVFSFAKVKTLFSFGWKLLVSGLLDTLYINLQSLVIGKKFSAATLGYYNRGRSFPELVMTNVNGSINAVMLPAYSAEQDDKKRLKVMMRRSIMTSSFFVLPAMAGLAAVAKPLVLLLLTEKWLPAVPFLQLSCIIYAFWPIHTANLQAINAMGRSDIFLKLEIIKKTFGVIILIITVFYFDSVMAILIGSILTVPISMFLNAYPNDKLLNYNISEQVKDILPSLGISLAMGVLVWCVSLLHLGAALTLVIQLVLGALIYVTAAKMLKIEAYSYIRDIISESIQQRQRKIGKQETDHTEIKL